MTGAGFTNNVMNAKNVNFTGANPSVGQVTADGQLLIGSTALPNIRVGNITSTDGSITITNGSGTIDLSGSAQGFTPNAVLQEFDDFLSGPDGSIGLFSKLQWTGLPSFNFFATSGTADHPGIYTFTPGALNLAFFLQTTNSSGVATGGTFKLGGGVVTLTWVIQLPTLSGGGDTYQFTCGLADSVTLEAQATDAFVDGVFFQYTDSVNSGNWQLKSTNTSVTTTSNTSTAASTSFVSLTISINADASLVTYFINGNSVGTIATNIPTAAITPFIFAKNTAGTTPNFNVDLFYITNVLSNPRPGPSPGSNPANYRFIGNYTQTAVSYQALSTDAIIGVSSTAAARTITMPSGTLTTGQWWRIKDESGGAATHNITIDGNGYNIDGSGTYAINNNYGSVDIYFNGSAYFIS